MVFSLKFFLLFISGRVVDQEFSASCLRCLKSTERPNYTDRKARGDKYRCHERTHIRNQPQ